MAIMMKSSRDGPICYICDCSIAPNYLMAHLRFDHTTDEVAYHYATVLLDDWKDEHKLPESAGHIEPLEA